MTIKQISERQFDEIAEAADLERGPTRFYYDARNSSIVVCGNESPIHKSTIQYFTEVVAKAQETLSRFQKCNVIMGGMSKTDLYFENETETTSLKGNSLDISLMVIVAGEGSLSQYPTIAVEVGCSETYEMLKKDVEAWLLGSLGYVRCAILVKLEKPALGSNFSDINLWGGYIEVYHLIKSDR